MEDLRSFLSGSLRSSSSLVNLSQKLRHGISPWKQDRSPAWFIKDLCKRHDELHILLSKGIEGAVWLSGLFDIRAYLTATRQETAKILELSLEKIEMHCVLKKPVDCVSFEISGLRSQCFKFDDSLGFMVFIFTFILTLGVG